MQPQQKPSRPTGVTVLAAVAFVGGIFGLLGGAQALSAASTESLVLGAVVVVFGILGLALGVGFLGGRRWAWTIGVIVYILSLPLRRLGGPLRINYRGWHTSGCRSDNTLLSDEAEGEGLLWEKRHSDLSPYVKQSARISSRPSSSRDKSLSPTNEKVIIEATDESRSIVSN